MPEKWFSQSGLHTSSKSNTWELVKNAGSQVSSQAYRIRYSGDAAQQCMFEGALQGMLPPSVRTTWISSRTSLELSLIQKMQEGMVWYLPRSLLAADMPFLSYYE